MASSSTRVSGVGWGEVGWGFWCGGCRALRAGGLHGAAVHVPRAPLARSTAQLHTTPHCSARRRDDVQQRGRPQPPMRSVHHATPHPAHAGKRTCLRDAPSPVRAPCPAVVPLAPRRPPRAGVPWDITARDYVAQGINRAFGFSGAASKTGMDVIAVSAMEAVGFGEVGWRAARSAAGGGGA